MKYFSHLNTAVDILQDYKGEQPFDIFIKQFFSQHKKYGSKDRKSISQLCYAYFRLGKALPDLPAEERIITGFWLCSQQPNEVLDQLRPALNETAALPTKQKIDNLPSCAEASAGKPFTIDQIFPWKEAMSAGVDHALFNASFLIQPNLFLRIRPGATSIVKDKLEKAGILFTALSPSCFMLPNASKLDGIIEMDKEAVIQDESSQRVGELMQSAVGESSMGNRESSMDTLLLKVWDCCAASGGKSIMAYDLLKPVDLTVSDVRPSILQNLKKRFAAAGINKYQSFVADLTNPTADSRLLPPHGGTDLLIADVPCTGSGTWSRTPEQLYYFDPAAIDRYSALQKKIVGRVIPCLRPGGRLLYITCSVFKKENEEVVQYMMDQFNLRLEKSELLKGYDHKADTLFAALLTSA